MVGLISARRVKAARISQSHARDLPCLAGDRGLGRRCGRRHIRQTGHLPAAALIAGAVGERLDVHGHLPGRGSAVAVLERGIGAVGDVVDVAGRRPGQRVRNREITSLSQMDLGARLLIA